MTKSKRPGLAALLCAIGLGGLTAVYRAKMAAAGAPLTFGGVGYEPGFLYGAAAVCLVALAFAARLVSRQRDESEPAGLAFKLAVFAAGLGMVFAAAAGFFQRGAGMLELVESVFALVCGVALLARAIVGETGQTAGLLSLFPVYFLCFFLLKFYRANAANPSIQSYVFEIIAAVLAVLAVYSISSARFEKLRGFRHVFLCLSCGYFTAVEAVSAAVDSRLVFGVPGMDVGSALMLFSIGIYVCAGLFIPSAEEMKNPPVQAEEETEADGELTAEKILADELTARLSDEE